MNITEKKATKISRISAAIVDLAIAFISYLFLSMAIISPVLNGSTTYKDNYKVYENGLISTGLYEKKDNQLYALINNEFDVKNNDKYDHAIINFYKSMDEKELVKYNEAKKQHTDLFTYNEETLTYSLKEDVDSVKLKNFYVEQYTTATNLFLTKDKDFNKAYSTLLTITRVCDIVGISIPVLIFYVLIPLLKKGRTLAKSLFKLEVIQENGEPLTRKQIALRQIVYAVLGVSLSLFTVGFPLVLCLIFVLASKNNLCPHDYLTHSFVIENDFHKVSSSENENVIEGTIINETQNEENKDDSTPESEIKDTKDDSKQM